MLLSIGSLVTNNAACRCRTVLEGSLFLTAPCIRSPQTHVQNGGLWGKKC